MGYHGSVWPMGSALQTFARMLGIAEHQAEDALHSERAAKAVLSRRSFFAAGAALAAGTAFAEIHVPVVPPPIFYKAGSMMGLMAMFAYASTRMFVPGDVQLDLGPGP